MTDFVYETVIAEEGDTVDLIAWRRFGSSSGPTEAILDANPGLAANAIIEAGRAVRIPVPVKKDRAQGVNIWS